MAIKYDITKDYLYQLGYGEGIKEAHRKFVESVLKQKILSTRQIAQCLQVRLKYVQQIAAELEEPPPL